MSKLFIFISAIVMLFSTTGSSHSSLYWIKAYGDTADEEAYSIKQTIDDGYVVTGTKSIMGGNKDILVLKLDGNGNVDWQKIYDKNEVDEAFSIQPTSDGGFILAGNTGPGITGFNDVWILKLNDQGDILWQKTYGSSENDDYACSIQQTTDGGYIVVGGLDGFTIWVFKLNSQGDILWEKDFGNRIFAKDIRQTADGGYIVLGRAGYTEYAQLVIKLDSNGDISWTKSLAQVTVGYGLSYPSSIIQNTNGEYIVLGKYMNYEGVGGVSIIKLDSNGNLLRQMLYGEHSYIAHSIQQTTDGGYTIAGSGITADSNAWILKLNSAGAIEWQKIYNESDEDCGYSIQQTVDGGYIVAGYTVTSSGDKDAWILKLDSFGDIPDCTIVGANNADISNFAGSMTSCCSIEDYPYRMVVNTHSEPQENYARVSVACCSDNDDNDCDGMPDDEDNCWESDNPEQLDSDGDCPDPPYSSDPMCGDACEDSDGDGIPDDEDDCVYDPYNDIDADGSCGDIDNCPYHPNASDLGTCIIGNIRQTCTSHEACGIDGYCSMAQEDSYPPGGNECGDACECEGNFNPDEDDDVDGSDAAIFKADFGRAGYNNPCESGNPCNGDFDCDSDVDGSEAFTFKEDFGRNQYFNPCPNCVTVPWCE